MPETSHFTGEAPERLTISNQMHKAWIAFAHNGSPNTKELPDWPKYNLEDSSRSPFISLTLGIKITNRVA